MGRSIFYKFLRIVHLLQKNINQPISLRAFLYNSIRSDNSVRNILLNSSMVKMTK